nr:MAG TPA: hypothetical protein [Caudoviricetes sp.]
MNKKKSPTKYRPICFYCGGLFVGIHRVTAARMMIQ